MGGAPIDTLACPACRTEYLPSAWIESATRCWPNQRWVAVRCPACDRAFHLELTEREIVRIGELDGAPGPLFMTLAEATSDIDARWTSTGLHVTSGDHTRTIRA